MEDFSDLYIKDVNDPFYVDTKVETTNKLDAIISKIYMVLLTNKGDVIGDFNFGADIPKYLWKTKFPAESIKMNIIEQFEEYIPELSTTDYIIDVYILPGQVQDIGVISISLGITSINILFK